MSRDLCMVFLLHVGCNARTAGYTVPVVHVHAQ